MFKLVVLFALLAVVAAKPGYLGAAVAYTAPAVAVPSAVSYQARTDVISKPVVATTYAAHAPVVASYAAPAYGYGAYGYAAPAVVKSYDAYGYAAPAVVKSYGAYGYAAPAVVKSYGSYGYAAPLHYY